MTKISNLYALTNYISANSSGNVVIAAPSSGYALDVNGTGRFTGALSGTSATFTGLIVTNTSDVYPEIKTSATDADAFLGFSNTGDGNAAWSIGRRNTGEFWISTYTGNFNSGTRTEPLKIATSGAATFSSSVTAGGDLTMSGGNRSLISSGGFLQMTSTSGAIYLSPNSSTAMTLTTSGNVGIGTTAPFTSSGYKVLDLYGASSGGHFLVRSPNVTAEYQVDEGSGGAYFGTRTNHFVSFRTNTSERMRITSAGQVLIGQTVASGNVNGVYIRPGIESGFIVTSDVALQLSRLGTTGIIQTFYSGSTRVGQISVTGSTISLESNSNGGLTVNSSGSVGIGTTNPLSQLHVAGNILSQGLRLNISTANQGHRFYSRTMDVSAYTTNTNMRFAVTGGNNVQFQYEIVFHATRLSGTLAEIWYLRYTAGIAYDTAGNPNERWWDLREQAGNGIAGVGRSNNTGYFDITNSAFDTACRLTCVVKITCSNWDAVTVTFP